MKENTWWSPTTAPVLKAWTICVVQHRSRSSKPNVTVGRQVLNNSINDSVTTITAKSCYLQSFIGRDYRRAAVTSVRLCLAQPAPLPSWSRATPDCPREQIRRDRSRSLSSSPAPPCSERASERETPSPPNNSPNPAGSSTATPPPNPIGERRRS